MRNSNYQRICSNLLKGLPQRTVDIIERRFGLKEEKPQTLEAIGQIYGRTRERIRQIEEDGLLAVKEKLSDYKDVLKHFEKILESFGGFKEEKELLEFLGGKKAKNHVFFLLTIAQNFNRSLEDNKFYSFWVKDKKSAKKARSIVNSIINRFKKEKKPLSLKEILEKQKTDKNILLSSIGISKEIEKNPEGKFGLKGWIEINPRGIKDRAYLVLKREEKPLHFRDIANLIDNLPFPSGRKSHIATVHNELIKDQRFVLVGRGLYALSEWGYRPGVVKDVIYQVLKEAKRPLTKKQILDKVLEQRFVKTGTITLNLQNNDCFIKDNKGRYRIA